jgi:N-glycosylase/DNA lyase
MKLQITKQDRQALNKVFENFGRPKTEEEIFYSLCFCICAPQTTFKANTKVIQKLKELDFYYFGEAYEGYCGIDQIEEILKPVRFYRNKTKYLLEIKRNFNEILAILKIFLEENDMNSKVTPMIEIREWLVKTIKGMGMKVASHFLRNLGDTSLAILDVHIIKFLAEQIGVPLNLTYENAIKYFKKVVSRKQGYLDLEKIFQNIAKENELSTAMLDAYLWKFYSGTSWENFKY